MRKRKAEKMKIADELSKKYFHESFRTMTTRDRIAVYQSAEIILTLKEKRKMK